MNDVRDFRTQTRMQRMLEIELRHVIDAALQSGLDPDRAWEAAKSVYDEETRLERSRKENARSYL